jgi:hypothetical protein
MADNVIRAAIRIASLTQADFSQSFTPPNYRFDAFRTSGNSLTPAQGNVATLSERFLRHSVAKGINGMSHQHTDAQNEGRSYNSRKHERLLGLNP